MRLKSLYRSTYTFWIVLIISTVYLNLLQNKIRKSIGFVEQLAIDEFDEAVKLEIQKIHFPYKVIEYFAENYLKQDVNPLIHDPFLEEISKLFDIRLAPLLTIASYRQTASVKKVSFSWDSWINLQERLTYRNLNGDKVSLKTCEQFQSFFNINSLKRCKNLNGYFSISGPISGKLPISARRIIGANYLHSSGQNPDQLMFLDAIHNDFLILQTKSVEYHPNFFYKMAIDFIKKETNNCEQVTCIRLLSHGLNFQEELSKLSLIDSLNVVKRSNEQDHHNTSILKTEFESNRSFEGDINNIPKYFYEANLSSKNYNGAHYDWRFFNKYIVDDNERLRVLHRMSKAWLNFCAKSNIRSWLMHGTLLGYYFNGLNMPFDGDLDVMVTLRSLEILADKFNNTLVIDLNPDDMNAYNYGIGSYLIDVNPYYKCRVKGNGNNTIDARFIDTHTGLYIDITSVSTAVNTSFDITDVVDFKSEFFQILDPDYLTSIKLTTVNQETYTASLRSKFRMYTNDSQFLHCKNNHFYTLDEISPLRPVLFEGKVAYIPNCYERILKREYNKALSKFRFKNYLYRKTLRLWVSSSDCQFKQSDSQCLEKSRVVQNEFKITQNFTKNHSILHRKRMTYDMNFLKMESSHLSIHRDDPWLVEYAISIATVANKVKAYR